MPISITRRDALTALGCFYAASSSLNVAFATAREWPMSQGIPDAHVRPATRWLLDQYSEIFKEKVSRGPVTLELLCAVACQESAYTWFDRRIFKTGRSASEMMQLLLLDNVHPRRYAFPRDTPTFLQDRRYHDIAGYLIEMSDASRVARGYTKTGNLLFGYGLFQYDLQHIQSDPRFWRDSFTPKGALQPVRGLWGDVGACTDRFLREMEKKIDTHPGNLEAAVAAYNGSGPNAQAYAKIVLKFRDLAAREIGA